MGTDDEPAERPLREAVFDRDGRGPQPIESLNLDISVNTVANVNSRELIDRILTEHEQIPTALVRLREQAFAEGRSVFDETVEDAISQLKVSVAKDRVIVPPTIRSALRRALLLVKTQLSVMYSRHRPAV